MSRFIDADALIEKFKAEHDWSSVYIVEDMPTADVVEVVRGYWIVHRNAEISHGRLITNYECSICRTWSRYHSNYCPDCGAYMRGEYDAEIH